MTSETDALSSDRQLKTLVLTDLCDSVALTARIGDAAAAELFRTLDVRALQLLQRWKGRLIDRSDGMFLLFDVPTQGLGFALDYLDALAEIGRERKLPLQARIGIHVGDVLFWRNDDDAVAAGAKPLEVEGVAKPTAARLMALARPNQILLSAVAEALLRAGQRELGERGANLQWKSHGCWYFKGLPTPQEVFEVGAAGSAPLRMPARSNKAWRRLPVWRRPAALVAELLLVAAIGAVAWVLVRPEPAIAFAERDWVVVGDFSNQTGNLVLDDALQQALRISLEQSRHVNVLSDLKVRETLRQMRRDPAQPLDRDTAKEVAIRDGARAVVMPGVLELHGKLRIIMEVLDPASGRVVYSAYADGDGLDSALSSLDKVAAAIRLKLGEATDDLGRTSLPLPRVATSNLDALHAYAMGVDAYAEKRRDDAEAYLEQAEHLDPAFAAAYMAQMRIAYSRGDTILARELLEKAVAYRDDLTPREGLYLDAWGAEINGAGAAESAYKWKLLGDLYPDYHAAYANRSNALFTLGQYPEAERSARGAVVPQNSLRLLAQRQLARTQLAQNKLDEAKRNFQEIRASDERYIDSELAAALAAQDDFAGARAVLDALPKEDMSGWLQRIAIAVDAGRPEEALVQARAGADQCKIQGYVCSVFRLQELTVLPEMGHPVAAATFERELQWVQQQALQAVGADTVEWVFIAASALYLAQRTGHQELVASWLPRLDGLVKRVNDPRSRQLLQLLYAGQEVDRRRMEDAVARLQKQVDGTELLQLHVVLAGLYVKLGRPELAESQRQWLAQQRGLAYAENAGTYALKARNVADVRQVRR